MNSKLSNAYVKGINRTTNSTGGLRITPARADQYIVVLVTGPSDRFGIIGLMFYDGALRYGTSFAGDIKPTYSGGSALIPVGGWSAGIGISYLNFSIEHYV